MLLREFKWKKEVLESNEPGCDVEQCPRCGHQALSCDCEHREPETGEIIKAGLASGRYSSERFPLQVVAKKTCSMLRKAWTTHHRQSNRSTKARPNTQCAKAEICEFLLDGFEKYAQEDEQVLGFWNMMAEKERKHLIDLAFADE